MAAKDHIEAQRDYEAGMKYKDIAEKHGVSINTVKSWQKRFKWARKKGAPKPEKGCTQNIKRETTKKRGAPFGSKNALGNKGGHGAPPGNHHAEKHGFFSRIFPDDEETLAIVKEIQIKSPLDMLWENIVIQYTAIARAQKLMWVRDQQDKTIEKVGYQKGKIIGEKWEVQHAWDKHANFLQAQSRAIQTLERLIARYEELLLKDLDTEEQKLRIDKLKAELDKIKNPTPEADMTSYVDALKPTAKEVWADEEAGDKEGDEGEADE